MAAGDAVAAAAPAPAPRPLETESRILESAVREAAAVAMSHFRGPVRHWTKGDASPVSEADLAVDAALKASLSAASPGHGWISEETASAPSASGRSYVVDPIDGTRAYLNGETGWSLSVAVIEAGRPVAAVVYRPTRDEMFSATRGGGAFRDGDRLAIRACAIEGATVAARRKVFDEAGLGAAGLVKGTYMPSLALRLCYVATGRFDAALTKAGANHWDLAAADLVLSEAGGVLTDLAGAALDYSAAATQHGPVVAGLPELAETLARLGAAYEAKAAG